MCHLLARPPGRLLLAALFTALLLTLGACGDLASALPARPTPVPTLARLPSVTPVTPSATPPPTLTPAPVTTPTAVPLLGTVAIGANVREGPGIAFAVVGVLDEGAQVELLGRSGGWYEVAAPGGLTGWMSGQVLTIDPVTDSAVPATP
ncbi:MAG TPA: SH3 domain-containing protein [Chloroflexaceae bacterium]|nr:SH3 domain-containing protein [Chloroflexaceae bacterium]